MTPDDRPPLDYARPDPAPNLVGQCFAAAALTAILLVVGGVAWLFLVFAMTYGQAEWRSRLMVVATVVLGVSVLVGLNVLAYRKYRDPRRRGIGLGIWIGLGVALLLAGACFGKA